METDKSSMKLYLNSKCSTKKSKTNVQAPLIQIASISKPLKKILKSAKQAHYYNFLF